MRNRIPFGFVFALGICAILACDDRDEFRSDVIMCEEAVATLDACCPSAAVAKLRCKYLYEPNSVPKEESSSSDCGGPGCGCNSDRLVEPDLKESVSQCIVRAGCAGLTSTCAALARGEGASCR